MEQPDLAKGSSIQMMASLSGICVFAFPTFSFMSLSSFQNSGSIDANDCCLQQTCDNIFSLNFSLELVQAAPLFLSGVALGETFESPSSGLLPDKTVKDDSEANLGSQASHDSKREQFFEPKRSMIHKIR